MQKRTFVAMVAALSVVFFVGTASAQEEWRFGIGTGFTSFSLDGDIGFGRVVADVDLDNSDVMDLVESGFGLGGYAAKGKWTIFWGAGTATLEDDDGGLEAEWDRMQIDLIAGYRFYEGERNNLGVLFGIRNIDHDWEFEFRGSSASVDDSWTDAILGFTHSLPISERWSWNNRIDAGFGDSEGSFLISTSFNWQISDRWSLDFTARQHSIEFGEEGDDYFYDVDEPGLRIGFLYHW
jgi:hypothetical protein